MHTLLVHAPKMADHFGPLGDAMSVNYMAMGLPALAAAIEQSQRQVEILHLGVQHITEPGFSLSAEAARLSPTMAGFSLHWHPQTFDTVQAVGQVKAGSPKTFTVLGGFTASIFHEEILASHPEVDGVIRGDGEVPLRRLAEALDAGRPLSEVPNLTFRSSGQVQVNPIGYRADSAALRELDFERLDLLRHHRRYIRDFAGRHYVAHRRLPAAMMTLAQRVFGGSGRYMVLPVGRGCSVNCAWCGGGWSAHRLHSGRTGYSLLPAGRVAALTARAVELGFDGVHACFDPTPKDPSHWLEVFERLRGSGVRCGMLFESYAVPHPDLIAGMAKTFTRSMIAISPESPDEELRRKVRGLSFSNEEMIEAVKQCDAAGVDVMLCFGYGLPGETAAAIPQTRALFKRAQAAASRVKVLLRSFPIEMEPGAPWALQPERYGIELTRRTFADYLAAHTPGHTGPEAGLGYRMRGYFDEEPADFQGHLRETACRELCPLPPSPTRGRLTCAALRRVSGGGSCG